MQLFTKIFCASALVIFCFNLNAMDPGTHAICSALDALQAKITKENQLKGELFASSVVKKAEKPEYYLDPYYGQRLLDAQLLNSNGSMSKVVADGVKMWAKTRNRTTDTRSFNLFLTQQKPYETHENQQ